MKYDWVLPLVRPAASSVVLSREKVLNEAALHPGIRRGLHISGSAYMSAALRHTWELIISFRVGRRSSRVMVLVKGSVPTLTRLRLHCAHPLCEFSCRRRFDISNVLLPLRTFLGVKDAGQRTPPAKTRLRRPRTGLESY